MRHLVLDRVSLHLLEIYSQNNERTFNLLYLRRCCGFTRYITTNELFPYSFWELLVLLLKFVFCAALLYVWNSFHTMKLRLSKSIFLWRSADEEYPLLGWNWHCSIMSVLPTSIHYISLSWMNYSETNYSTFVESRSDFRIP